METLRPEPINWLVPGYIPRGKVTLLAGPGGVGKSTVTTDLIACLTMGRPAFGLEYDSQPPQCDCLLASAEDDSADTIVPRLLAAGADRSRVHEIECVMVSGKRQAFGLDHVVQLDQTLAAKPEIGLVIIDPIGVFFGRTRGDSHRESDVQEVLSRLRDIAQARRVAIVVVGHVNKNEMSKAANRVSGSVAFVNSARGAFMFCNDPEDDSRRLILPLKFNNGVKPRGLAYAMRSLNEEELARVRPDLLHLGDEQREQLERQLYVVHWKGQVDSDVDDAVGNQGSGSSDSKSEEAAKWLLDYLDGMAHPSTEVEAAGARAGFSTSSLQRGRKKACIRAAKITQGLVTKWWWGVGEKAEWTFRPNPDEARF